MSKHACQTCVYFRVTIKQKPVKGECHFYAPQPSSILKQGEHVTARTAMWPLVRGEDYCGQYEAAPVAQAKPGEAKPA